jgi:hypothetical protein
MVLANQEIIRRMPGVIEYLAGVKHAMRKHVGASRPAPWTQLPLHSVCGTVGRPLSALRVGLCVCVGRGGGGSECSCMRVNMPKSKMMYPQLPPCTRKEAHRCRPCAVSHKIASVQDRRAHELKNFIFWSARAAPAVTRGKSTSGLGSLAVCQRTSVPRTVGRE